MQIAIVTSLTNGAGLQRDYHLIAGLLRDRGHEVTGVEYRGERPGHLFDLAIFLEVYDDRFAGLAPRAWMVPNPEWWYPRWNGALRTFQWVLCKTRDCQGIFRPHAGDRAVYTGFMSEDRRDPTVPRERFFLHAAGVSTAKGTAYVLDAWERLRGRYRLIVVGGAHVAKVLPGVEYHRRVEEAEYRRLQNAAFCHVCTSEYEGWGHYLHEALSVGAVVITTDGPPMNEWAGPAIRVPAGRRGKLNMATASIVSEGGVAAAVEQAAAFSDAEVARLGGIARAAFEEECADFIRRFDALLDTVRL